MNITLRQIRAFVAVAELGRFNLAASHLHLTQSAISMLVKELEAALGAKLFDRHTRMVCLTETGAEFLPQARRLLDDLEIAVGNVQDITALRRGHVAVAAAIVLAATLLPPHIARFARRYPDIGVQLKDMAEEEICLSLKRNEVDLGVGTSLDGDTEIEETPLFRDHLTLVCRPDHPLAGKESVRWRDLGKETLISFQRSNPLRRLVDHGLAIGGANVRPSHEVRFSTTAISLIALGFGVAVLPQNSRQLATRVDVTAVDLVDPVVHRDIALFRHRQRMLSPAAARFKDLLIAEIASGASA